MRVLELVLFVAVVLGVSIQALGANTSQKKSQKLFKHILNKLFGKDDGFETFESDDAAQAIAAFNERLEKISGGNQVAINWDGGAVTDITQGGTTR